MKLIQETKEEVRFEEFAPGCSMLKVINPKEPVPVGTLVARLFRVAGYDPDCDGSLMARLDSIDSDGRETGWSVRAVGLYPGSAVILESPDELHRLANREP